MSAQPAQVGGLLAAIVFAVPRVEGFFNWPESLEI
jgi:hypothetical protein